jgi:hypothetical protein
MATQTLSTADAILKDLYVGPIVEQLNYKTYLLDQIERDSDSLDHTGRRAVWPVHKSGNRGRGSFGDGGQLPTAGRQDWVDAIIPIKYHAYAISVTDAAIEGSKRSEGAFINILEAETKGVARDMRKDINRQVYGLGTGQLAANANATVTGSGTTGTPYVLTADSIQYVKIGDTVDVIKLADGTTGVGGIGLTVTGRSTANKTVNLVGTLTTPGSVDQTYGLYLRGSYGNEMDGLRNMVGTSRTLHSINSATAGNEFWNAGSVKSAGGATAGESLFEQVADDVGQYGNGEIDVFLTTRGIRRRLADTYASQKRMNDARMVDIHGGYTAIMVNEIPVVLDDDCPKGFAFGINKDSFKWFQQAGPSWLESKDGTVFQLQPGGTLGTYNAAWLAWFKWYASFANIAPQRNAVISSCADDLAV